MQSHVPGTIVYGLELKKKCGCLHYNSPLDILALKFKCCQRYYACRFCHDELADHPTELYDSDNTLAVLCRSCETELCISAYLNFCSHCPNCLSPFNPGCKAHWDLYFKNLKLQDNDYF